MHGGVDELLMRAVLIPRTAVSFDHLRASFDQDVDGATSAEAVWLVTSAWLHAGRSEEVRAAIEQIRAGFATLPTSDLIRGVADVLEARLQLSLGNGRGRRALAPRRAGAAPPMRAMWWVRRGLRLLDQAGLATPDESAEAGGSRLGSASWSGEP